jgi:murein DD-endopeptidase MepM/ murein hydrolase activator NlpD
MIGLALSMGASSLLIPRHSDGATAAEPVKGAEAAVPLKASVDALSVPTVTMVEHVVAEGQTLKLLAQRYHVGAEIIATLNNLAPNATLKAGQVLKIPVSNRSLNAHSGVRGVVSGDSKVSFARASRMVASADLTHLSDLTVNSVSDRNDALNRLRQERGKLQASLAELGSEESNGLIVSSIKDGAAAGLQSKLNASKQLPEVVQPNLVASHTDSGANQAATTESRTSAYQVRPGDTLAAIARDHELSPMELAAANLLSDPNLIQPNQSLVLPQSRSSNSTVQPVQTAHLPLNATNPSVPTSGASVEQPVVPLVASASNLVAYRVNPGDTLAQIARSHNIPQSLLIDTNHLSDPNILFVGQELRIPEEQSTASLNSTGTVPLSSSSTAAVPTVPSTGDAQAQPRTLIPAGQTINPTETAAQVAVAPTAPVPVFASDAEALSNQKSTSDTLQGDSIQGSNHYVQGLLAEVRALRERNLHTATPAVAVEEQAPTAIAAVGGAAAPVRPAEPVNPEFAASRTGAPPSLPTPSQAVQQQEATSPGAARPNLVASAPLGSENYAPLVQPITGRMVSPDLPSLPDANIFLPNGVFKGFIWPTRGVITSGYGWRWGRMHQGIDIANAVGSPVDAAADGVVEYAGWNSGGYGNMIDIRHADGSLTRYGHLNAVLVREGQRVQQGQQIGEMGSTGYSTGPHLHFEVHPAHQGAVNPISYLPPRQ